MFNYRGGNRVRSGFYWNLGKWEIVTIGKEGGTLPESEGHRYVKLPVLVLLLVAPWMGLVYVIFLPFIGFALLFGLAGKKLARSLVKAVAKVKAIVASQQQA